MSFSRALKKQTNEKKKNRNTALWHVATAGGRGDVRVYEEPMMVGGDTHSSESLMLAYPNRMETRPIV